jgi:hypothetical protein
MSDDQIQTLEIDRVGVPILPKCASCGVPTDDMGKIGDVVTGESMPTPKEGDVLVCGRCAALNVYNANGELEQGKFEDVMKRDVQDCANVVAAQTAVRERMTFVPFEPCGRKMCFNAARKQLFLLLRPKNFTGPAAEMSTGFRLCDCHAVKNPDLYLTAESWAQILEAFDKNGKQRPHRASVEVLFRSLDDTMVKSFDAIVAAKRKEQNEVH